MTSRTARRDRDPWRRAAVLTIASAVALSGCGAPEPVTGAAVTAAVDAQPVVLDPDGEPGVIAAEEAVLDAELLVLTLEQLLGDHVLQIAGAAVLHAEGTDTDTALAQLDDNTAALTGAIGLVYGEVGADAFASLWSQHIAFLLDHAQGRAEGDAAVMAEADGHLGHYETGFGSFASTATEGALPAEVVADLLAVHVADINGHVADVLDEDAQAATRGLIAGHDYAADIGVAIGEAIAGQGPRAFPSSYSDARKTDARELARALAAHVVVRATHDLTAPAQDDVEAADGSAPDIADEVAARVDAALGAVAADPGRARVLWRELTAVADGPANATDDTRADRLLAPAAALASELGVPDAAPALVAIVDGPRATRTGDELSAAQAGAYAVATAWLTASG